MSSKIGFVRNATKHITYKQPQYYLSNESQGRFIDSEIELDSVKRWKNDREIEDEDTQRYMKPSRVNFLRRKGIEKYKWNQFLNYVCENYETIRENAREISRGPHKLAKIEKANAWLGDYHN